ERTAPRTSLTSGINQPAQFPDMNPGSAEAKTGRRWFPRRGVHFGWTLRILLLVVMAVLPMIAIQAWHERDLRTEREEVIEHRVVHKAQRFPRRSASCAKVLDNCCWQLASWSQSNSGSQRPVLHCWRSSGPATEIIAC